MYDLETIKRTALRLNQEPSDIALPSPVLVFNSAWNVFLETIDQDPAYFATRLDYEERGIKDGLPLLTEAHQSIQLATRYVSMMYLSCGLAMAQQRQNAARIPQAATTRTISNAANKVVMMNTYVHAFMNQLSANRSYLVNPLSPNLRDALGDYYTVVTAALMEIKPHASQTPHMQGMINTAIQDSMSIAQKNGLNLNIPNIILKRAATSVAINSPNAPVRFPAATSRAVAPYHEDIARVAYKPTAKPAALEPTRPEAKVLYITPAAREEFRKRRLVDAAKRTNPTDPGRPPRPDQPTP